MRIMADCRPQPAQPHAQVSASVRLALRPQGIVTLLARNIGAKAGGKATWLYVYWSGPSQGFTSCLPTPSQKPRLLLLLTLAVELERSGRSASMPAIAAKPCYVFLLVCQPVSKRAIMLSCLRCYLCAGRQEASQLASNR